MISANVDIVPAPFVPRMVKYLRKLLMSKKMRVTAFVQNSTNRILAVQAQEDFVDFLFSLLTIPLGKAEFILHGDTGLGSVDNLYRCIPSLNVRKSINTENHSINSLLNPTIPRNYVSVTQILPLAQKSSHMLLSKYDDFRGRHQRNLEMTDSRDMDHYELKGLKPNAYMVTDDLVVMTSSANYGVSKLQATGIPLHDIETHVLDIGMEEALNILKASLTSSFALTNGLKQSLRRRKTRKMKCSSGGETCFE
ncbi:uncharacterized protein [Primulina eburnea]|uniref:uncharacterized protein n=1 Tax=Primulina eburnea TaxID=1245227 RepID=UPI003C6C304D